MAINIVRSLAESHNSRAKCALFVSCLCARQSQSLEWIGEPQSWARLTHAQLQSTALQCSFHAAFFPHYCDDSRENWECIKRRQKKKINKIKRSEKVARKTDKRSKTMIMTKRKKMIKKWKKRSKESFIINLSFFCCLCNAFLLKLRVKQRTSYTEY